MKIILSIALSFVCLAMKRPFQPSALDEQQPVAKAPRLNSLCLHDADSLDRLFPTLLNSAEYLKFSHNQADDEGTKSIAWDYFRDRIMRYLMEKGEPSTSANKILLDTYIHAVTNFDWTNLTFAPIPNLHEFNEACLFLTLNAGVDSPFHIILNDVQLFPRPNTDSIIMSNLHPIEFLSAITRPDRTIDPSSAPYVYDSDPARNHKIKSLFQTLAHPSKNHDFYQAFADLFELNIYYTMFVPVFTEFSDEMLFEAFQDAYEEPHTPFLKALIACRPSLDLKVILQIPDFVDDKTREIIAKGWSHASQAERMYLSATVAKKPYIFQVLIIAGFDDDILVDFVQNALPLSLDSCLLTVAVGASDTVQLAAYQVYMDMDDEACTKPSTGILRLNFSLKVLPIAYAAHSFSALFFHEIEHNYREVFTSVNAYIMTEKLSDMDFKWLLDFCLRYFAYSKDIVDFDSILKQRSIHWYLFNYTHGNIFSEQVFLDFFNRNCKFDMQEIIQTINRNWIKFGGAAAFSDRSVMRSIMLRMAQDPPSILTLIRRMNFQGSPIVDILNALFPGLPHNSPICNILSWLHRHQGLPTSPINIFIAIYLDKGLFMLDSLNVRLPCAARKYFTDSITAFATKCPDEQIKKWIDELFKYDFEHLAVPLLLTVLGEKEKSTRSVP